MLYATYEAVEYYKQYILKQRVGLLTNNLGYINLSFDGKKGLKVAATSMLLWFDLKIRVFETIFVSSLFATVVNLSSILMAIVLD